ncbi:hypothetical protein [Nocardia goodfellowii]|uniref:XRE family transcriptional regulator n=1 Tax=Nocardia goodfellowii TaxID=882446 RepID=A0ABS4QH39_9NOCA|nr:hypothetical protein [Nocardia goodfellowii]MBP2191013.1 hypothetical protein [Nocardia goodfellowii]
MRDLTDLADRLAGDMSLDEAVGHLDITARKAVADWFDKQPERRPVAEVTALCFALGADVRTFETMLVSFERRLGEHMPEPQATVDVPPETGLRQVRHARNRPDSLIVRERGESADGLGTGMRFRSSGYQRHVLGMLCDRMDVEFWNAVRVWLDDVDIGSDHSRPLVADGLTTLAEVAFDEAFDVLERWSAGARGRNGQIVAAIVLSSMSYRDHLAPRALQIATTWITRKNGARQWVAAVAFGNALGVRYPHEAIARLWTLCAQAHAAQRDMTPIIGMLFTDLVVEAGDPGIVLRTITKAAGRQGAARNMSRRQIAIAAGTAILSARDVHGRTAVSLFLERFPDKTAEIAGLLACVLGNRPTRIEAIRAIRRALQDLVKHTDRPETIAHRLGDALAAEMTISEGEQLKAEIARVRTQRGRTDSDKTAAALAALLARLERNTPDNKETQ